MNYINTESTAIGYCTTCRKTAQGKLDTYSDTTYFEDKPAGRVGDTVKAECGHTGIIMDGSTSVYIDGMLAATTASTIQGIYIARFIEGVNTLIEGG